MSCSHEKIPLTIHEEQEVLTQCASVGFLTLDLTSQILGMGKPAVMKALRKIMRLNILERWGNAYVFSHESKGSKSIAVLSKITLKICCRWPVNITLRGESFPKSFLSIHYIFFLQGMWEKIINSQNIIPLLYASQSC